MFLIQFKTLEKQSRSLYGDSLMGASPESTGPIMSESSRITFYLHHFDIIQSAEFGGRLLQNNNCHTRRRMDLVAIFNKLFKIWV